MGIHVRTKKLTSDDNNRHDKTMKTKQSNRLRSNGTDGDCVCVYWYVRLEVGATILSLPWFVCLFACLLVFS